MISVSACIFPFAAIMLAADIPDELRPILATNEGVANWTTWTFIKCVGELPDGKQISELKRDRSEGLSQFRTYTQLKSANQRQPSPSLYIRETMKGSLRFTVESRRDDIETILPADTYDVFGVIDRRSPAHFPNLLMIACLRHCLSITARERDFSGLEIAKMAKTILVVPTKNLRPSDLTFEFTFDKSQFPEVESLILSFSTQTPYPLRYRELRSKGGAVTHSEVLDNTSVEGLLLPQSVIVNQHFLHRFEYATRAIDKNEFLDTFPENCYVHDRVKGRFLLWGKGIPKENLSPNEFIARRDKTAQASAADTIVTPQPSLLDRFSNAFIVLGLCGLAIGIGFAIWNARRRGQ